MQAEVLLFLRGAREMSIPDRRQHPVRQHFPDSSTIYLTRADLAGLSQEQLRLARNEIYARHGRKFKTKEIQDYFNSKSWYTGTIESNAFKDEYLNSYEKENIKLIQSLEK